MILFTEIESILEILNLKKNIVIFRQLNGDNAGDTLKSNLINKHLFTTKMSASKCLIPRNILPRILKSNSFGSIDV